MNTKPTVIVHRGGGRYDTPENTLYAINKGLTYHPDGIEFDIRFTKDHVPVLFHDATLKRTTTTHSKQSFHELSFDEVKQLNVTQWFDLSLPKESPISLDQALSVLKGTGTIYIEVKASDPNMGMILKELLEKHDVLNDVIILSFHKDILYTIKQDIPEVPVMFLFSKWKQPYEEIIKLGFDTIGLSYRLANRKPKLVRFLKDHDIFVNIWSSNKKRMMRKFIRLGVDSITTDKPEVLQQILKDNR